MKKEITPHTVRAITEKSCSLACLESICFHNEIMITQAGMIAEYSNEFPHWKEESYRYILSDKDILKMAELLKLASSIKSVLIESPNSEQTQEQYVEKSTVGVLLVTQKILR